MARRKCCWTFLRENHHRNKFASNTYKDQRDSASRVFQGLFQQFFLEDCLFLLCTKKSYLALKTTES